MRSFSQLSILYIFMLSQTSFSSGERNLGSLLLGTPGGKNSAGETIQLAQTAKAATSVASGAAEGSSTAAQAIASATEAGIMYRMLLAKGVMDYFHRKQLEKANQKMAAKMEKLENELRSGKLNPAQFAAIKSAVEEAYQKNAKSDSPQEKPINPDPEKNEKYGNLDGEFDTAEIPSRIQLAGNREQESSERPSDLISLSSLQNQPRDEQSNTGLKKSEDASTSSQPMSGGLAPSVFSLTQNTPTLLPATGSSESPTSDFVKQKEKETFIRESQVELSRQSQEIEEHSFVNPEEELSDEFEFIPPSQISSSRSLVREISPKKSKLFNLAEFSGGLRKLFKPIKFQKTPFSLKPYSEEEGLHWGFLALGLLLAYGWGKKRSSVKSKIPHIIPEVVLSPRNSKNRVSRDRRQLNRG